MSIVRVPRSALPPGCALRIKVDGEEILLCNVDGAFYAVEDVCTHDGGPLDQGRLDGCEVECPRHGARFDVRTGAVTALPAVLPLRTFPTRLDGDEVVVEY